MFLCKYARCQCSRRVTGQHRYDGLRQDRTMVQFGSHLMHRRTGEFAACVQRPLMRMQPWKCRQQRRMDIDQPSGVTRHKPRCQNTHEARQRYKNAVFRITIPINNF